MKKSIFNVITKKSLLNIVLLSALFIIPDNYFMTVPTDEIKQLIFFILCIQCIKGFENKTTLGCS
ncbi:hypothetical protein C9I87_15765 [Photobacterium iliopiscarium]|uniref:hypothetical protein n=1 Tax=Photobacterium iliopiscarium TaxID=56192 RepID=UPI000D16EBAE|nr:hypothetical protein [Photobacterium iliopiscarium]PST89970.1 hypothetical protein C9I87_15765 [Photobacterium iliopiscarium]